MKLSSFLSIVCLVLPAFFASCGGSRNLNPSTVATAGDTIKMRYAENITMVRHNDYIEVKIVNPWDSTGPLHKYILVDAGKRNDAALPEGTIITIPVSNALVTSTVHTGLLNSLGAIDAIGGICEVEYTTDDSIISRVKSGRIIDCGNNMNPNMERIIQLRPQAVMVSPYENNDGYSKIESLGIPVIECADYMETSALGRAEWMRFYGLLFGKGDIADREFELREKEYNRLKAIATKTTERPKVITEQKYGQSWSVPGGLSTVAELIHDAGGAYPFDNYQQSGSVPLSPEKVLADAHDADVWFVKYYQPTPKTLNELGREAAVNSQFKAFKNKNVYGCNTRYSDFFDSTPFNPQLLLGDMIRCIHPELKDSVKSEKHYYECLQ